MKRLIIRMFFFICTVTFFQVSCNKKNEKKIYTNQLIVYSPHPFSFIEPLINRFELEKGIRIKIISKGSGELIQRIKDKNFYGDIIWGGSLPTLLSGIDYFQEYISVNEPYIMDRYKNKSGKITRFTAVPSVLMINENLIGDIKIEGFKDLLNPRLKGKIIIANPVTSSSSFEHLINQLYAMGGINEKGWDYITKLVENRNGKTVKRSSDVYKGVVDGKYTVGCTFEEAAANYVQNGAPIRIVYPVEGTAIIPDGIAIIKGSKNLKNAQSFIDFLTSKEIQLLISKELNRRSIRKDIKKSQDLEKDDNIKIINYNMSFVVKNKEKILQKYEKIINEQKKRE